MRYFYDTEFHEDGETIDLISIGIVAGDGRQYYAVNRDADWSRINRNQWLTENVVSQLPEPQHHAWKSKAEIRDEVKAFLLASTPPELWAWFSAYDHVVLAQLFGTMLDFPARIPMYTNDVRSVAHLLGVHAIPVQAHGLHNALADAHHVKSIYDSLPWARA